MFIVDGAHESGSRRQDIVNKDENRLLWCELDTFSESQLGWQLVVSVSVSLPNDIDELPDGQVLREVSPDSGTTSPNMDCNRRTAGTRYFFLSIVGISLFSAFSQMT